MKEERRGIPEALRARGSEVLMEPLVLVRFYHEIALKRGNRAWFLARMRSNLEQALRGAGVQRVDRGPMMAMVRLKDPGAWPEVRERLAHLIGAERFGMAYRVEPSVEALKGAVARLLEGSTASSFRISTRRSDKAFPMTSPEVNQEVGAFAQGLTGMPVDLEHPAVDVRVQLLQREALVSVEEERGPGGLPVGVGGPVAVMLSGGIDSPVAAYLMQRKGCDVLFIHFHSFPLVEGTSREKAEELVRLLTPFQFHSRLVMVPFGGVQQRIIVSTPPKYRVVVYRRFMVRIAQRLALKNGARALVTGESLGQVSSQTLDNMATIGAVAGPLPVLRPLVAMDKEEIVAWARRLGTYPISVLPDQDCCSLFVPRHPVTRSSAGELERVESSLAVEEMVEEALEGCEEREFRWPETFQRP